MASVYYSNAVGSDSNDGSKKALAVKTLGKAITQAQADAAAQVIYADAVSNEAISSATTYTGAASPSVKTTVIGVDFSGGKAFTASNPPGVADYKAGWKLTPAAAISVTFAGYWKLGGLTHVAGSGNSGFYISTGIATDVELAPDTTVSFAASTATANYFGSTTGSGFLWHMTMRDTPGKAPASRSGKVTFGVAGQTVSVYGGRLDLRNMLMLGSALSPTNLFTTTTARATTIDAEDVDFTNLSGALIYAGGSVAASNPLTASFRDCLIPSGVTLLKSGSVLAAGSRISVVRCGAPGTAFSNAVIALEGSQEEVTAYTLQGGATDNTTLRSWHVKSTAAGGVFEVNPVLIANDQTGSALTVAIEALWNGASAPTNAQVWIEVEALTASGSLLGTIASTGLANDLATPAAYAVSTATWNGTLTGLTKFRMSTQITPAQIGALKVTVKISAAAAAEMWFDPKPIVSGGPTVNRSIILPSGAMFNETQATIAQPVNVFLPGPVRRGSR